MKRGLFIFHRDFRIQDNIGLMSASKKCDELYTCFIFTPDQVGNKNDFRSQNAIQFMCESLAELSRTIDDVGGKLLFFYGNQDAILKKLISVLKIDGIFFNKDYTPYAIERTNNTIELCKTENIVCEMFPDYYLFEPGTITTGSSTNAYKKYTPFYEAVKSIPVTNPQNVKIVNLKNHSSHILGEETLTKIGYRIYKPNPNILVHGGRIEGLRRLKLAIREQKEYNESRDFFIYNTTHLSAYIKFGCISIREVHHFLKHNKGVIRELIWREFFAHVLFAYPNVLGKSYQPKFRGLEWKNSRAQFEKWKRGETGFPIVDAAMRELNATGYMHNRGRMMVASCLIKILLIDWRWGEKYFAQKLTDYDIASNNGGWQGISGTGVDMKPYFRDMNPWIQSSKFDKNAEYIKKWVPELIKVDAKDIHTWATAYNEPRNLGVKYPHPIVNYEEQKKKMIDMYEKNYNNN